MFGVLVSILKLAEDGFHKLSEGDILPLVDDHNDEVVRTLIKLLTLKIF